MASSAPTAAMPWRPLSPFLLATALAFVIVAATPRFAAVEFALAAALAAVVAAAALWLPWQRLPTAVQLGPALLFLVAAAFLRGAGGGIGSGIGAIALLPAVWMALHGTRRELLIVLDGVALYFLVPILVLGPGEYPAKAYGATVMVVAVGSIICFTAHGLVEQIRRQAHVLDGHARDLQRVAAIGRELMTSADARGRVCEAACELAGAAFAFLMEPDGRGGLVSTAMAGLDAPEIRSAPAGDQTPMVTAYTAAEPIFIDDVLRLSGLDAALWREHGSPGSMLFEPVLRAGTPAAVLVLGWSQGTQAGGRSAIVSLLAAEAAFAIETSDLVVRLTDLASVDALTGALNRRGWDDALRRAFADGDRTTVSVAVLDLDRFKDFNDSCGHQHGDRLLKEAAAAWRHELRAGDVLARYGGEEFAVLLPGTDLARAAAIADRLRAVMPGGQTCSAGVAQWDGREGPDALVRRADGALYEAKDAGRDRTTVDRRAA
jgi:diguanylate cyclase (GGDEF)-like protein